MSLSFTGRGSSPIYEYGESIVVSDQGRGALTHIDERDLQIITFWRCACTGDKGG